MGRGSMIKKRKPKEKRVLYNEMTAFEKNCDADLDESDPSGLHHGSLRSFSEHRLDSPERLFRIWKSET